VNPVTLDADWVALGAGAMMALGVVVGYAARWLQVRKVRAKLKEDYSLLDRACFERGCRDAQYPAPKDAVRCIIEEVK
jgi:hypothetical protein